MNMNKAQLLWHSVFKPFPIQQVFTPASSADLTFVRRTNIERKFRSQFKICGRQIIVYGHSGSGKTTFLNKYFNENKVDCVTVHCDTSMSFEQVLLNTFDQLGLFYTHTRSIEEMNGTTIGGGVEVTGLIGDTEYTTSQTRVSNYARLVNPQLTSQRLADTLGAANKVLVIEDFHKLAEPEKKKLADMLKVFIDKANQYPNLKVICIGAVDTAREIVKLDNNLKQRVYECEIPLLTDPEIEAIVKQGCKLLNIVMTQDLVERIVHYSNQLGALAHQLSYDMCESNGITRTQIKTKQLTGEHFESAIESYIDARSDTLMEIYDRAVKDPLGWYILRTFSNQPQSKMSLKVISKSVNTPEHPFSENEIVLKLAELCTAEVGILRSNFNSALFMVSDPFWGAFIKMRIAKEQADNDKAYKNQGNRNLQLQNQNDVEAILLRVLLQKYNPNKELLHQ